MPDLKPTAARVALLQAVAKGKVQEHYPIGPDPAYSRLDRGIAEFTGPRYATVTRACHLMRRAGWIQLVVGGERTSYRSPRMWEITDAGRAVLEEAAKKHG